MYGVVTMLSESWDYVGANVQRIFIAPGNSTITAQVRDRGVELTVDDGGGLGTQFSFGFQVDRGEQLGTGYYTTLGSDPANFSVSGDGRGCSVAGHFDVLRLDRAADGSLQRLHLTYEQRCNTEPPHGQYHLFGEVRIRRSPPAQPSVAPSTLSWPDLLSGAESASVPLHFVSQGTSDETITSVDIDGPDANAFVVDTDDCSGQTVAPGESCEVWLHFAPPAAGPRFATISFATSGNTWSATLFGNVPSGTTDASFDSDPNDWLGHGTSGSYDPTNARIEMLYYDDTGELSVTGDDGTELGVRLALPAGEPWATGTYPAGGWGSLGTPRMSVGFQGYSCNDGAGSFTIHSIKVGQSSVRSISLSYSWYCDGGPDGFYGTFDYIVPPDDPIPGAVSDLHVARARDHAGVAWTNPSDGDLASVLVAWRRGVGRFGPPNAGFFVADSLESSETIPDLPAKGSITVKVWAVDAAGQVSPGMSVVA